MEENDLYLLSANEAQLEHLRSFLKSDVKTNQLLAIGMMQSGGLPEALVEDVLRLYLDRRTGYTKKYSEEKVLVGVKSEVEELFKKYGYEALISPDRLHHIFEDGKETFAKMKSLGIDPADFVANFSLGFVLKSHSFPERAVAEKLRRSLWSFGTEWNFLKMGLTELPEVIGQFPRLRRLNLANNHLTDFPKSFVQLRELEELVLTRNNFSDYPEQLFRLRSLKFLDFSENKLTHFSSDFKELVNLEWLFLPRNFIMELPEEITGMESLKNLSLAFNSLTEIPPFIGDLQNLESLNLRGNNIERVPEAMRQLIKLRSLDLKDNPIGKNIPEKIKLKKLLPRYCELSI
jgi:hypothetical protein